MTAAGKKVVSVVEESKIKVEFLGKEKNNKLSFLLKNSSPVYANTLRRLMVEEVPTMAIEDVEIRENSSALYDEILAHRLGLVVLETDLKSYNLPNECGCKGAGCAKCTLKLTLSAKSEKDPVEVYASALKSKDPKVVPVYDKTLIAILYPGQKIKLEATAVLGQGKDHAKFSPGLFFYKYVPEITINKNCDNCGECIKECPKAVFKQEKGKVIVNEDNLYDCHLCNGCVDVCPKQALTVKGSESDFVFTVETWGSLSSKKIVEKATEIFEEKLKEFEKLLK
jgi:DNA-directed RNA polymerase subunit D